MTEPTRQPLVVCYLDDVHRLLAGVDPVERAEVVDGLREHVEASLSTGATEDQVRAVLAELGPPEAVAEEVYAAGPTIVAQAPRPLPARAPATSRAWLPVVVSILELLTTLVVLGAVGATGSVVESGSSASGGVTTTVSRYDGSPFDGLYGFFAGIPFWGVVVLLVAVCGLWSVREKLALVLLVPVVAVVISAAPSLGNAVAGVDGVYAASWVALALVVAVGGAAVVVLTRRALHRSEALSRA